MSELPPQTKALAKALEREPISYERILMAARALKLANIKDPLDLTDPLAAEAHDLIEQWRFEKNLHMRGVDSVEKASDIVRGALLWIEAGYSRIQDIQSAMEVLADEHADALRGGNQVITDILRSALEDLDGRLGRITKFETMPAKLADKVREAQEFAERGRVIDSVGVLTMALFDPRFKRLSPEVLDKIRSLRDDYKAIMDAERKTR